MADRSNERAMKSLIEAGLRPNRVNLAVEKAVMPGNGGNGDSKKSYMGQRTAPAGSIEERVERAQSDKRKQR